MKSEERTEPAATGDERTTLLGFLEYQRETLEWKCDGLTDDQLRRRAMPPSTLSLLGLVRHMAEVERGWFSQRVAGEKIPFRWVSEKHWDAEFDDVDTASVREAFAAWRAECYNSREIVKDMGLDETFKHLEEPLSLRWLLCHMIEEYARHNGHADLLREKLDGSTGE